VTRLHPATSESPESHASALAQGQALAHTHSMPSTGQRSVAPHQAPPGEAHVRPIRPLRMINPIRNYDWGSHTRLAHLQGREPSELPEAELWMGAHPNDPSSVVDEGSAISLGTWIERSPLSLLGAETLNRFGPRLPFLLKVLGIERALSLQVHPSSELALRGFAAEDARGIPRTARERSYVDRYAKPEFVYALSPMVALAGFRPKAEAEAALLALELPLLEPVIQALATPGRHGGILAALTTLLHWPADQRHRLAESATARCQALLAGTRPPGTPRAVLPDGLDGDHLAWVCQLAEDHPGDALLLAPLLMRLHHLPPGGTMFLPAGVPHSYLRGTCVEIMGNSDNVLRAGLTSNHISVDDLLEALDPDAGPVVGVPSHRSGGEQHAWDFPVEEFSLGHLVVGPGDGEHATTPASPLPHVLLCTRGQVTLHHDAGGPHEGELVLRSGESAFVPSGCAGLTVRGDGEVFRAAPGAGH
jgi:mannose-6-phosphate isomerase